MKFFGKKDDEIKFSEQYPTLAAALSDAGINEVQGSEKEIRLTPDQAEAFEKVLAGADSTVEDLQGQLTAAKNATAAQKAASDTATATVTAVTGVFGEAASKEGFDLTSAVKEAFEARAALDAVKAEFGEAASKEGFDLTASVKAAVETANAHNAADGARGTSANPPAGEASNEGDAKSNAWDDDNREYNKRVDSKALPEGVTPMTFDSKIK